MNHGIDDNRPGDILTLDPEDEAALARAEQALAALRETAAAAFDADLVVAERALQAAIDSPGEAERHLDALYEATHCIKGLGSSLDFDLLTDIGERLCRRLKQRAGGDGGIVALSGRHLAAMRQVLDRNLRGDGGAEGRALLESLDP